MFPNPSWKQILAALLLLLLMDLALYACWRVYQQEQLIRQLKLDQAELSHIKYGMLNMDVWQHRLTEILERKVAEYELQDESREQLRDQVRGLILRMIDTTAEVIRESHQKEGGFSGWLKQQTFSLLIDVEDLKADAPRIAEAFLSYLDQEENRDRIKDFVAAQIEDYAARTMGQTDYRRRDAILHRHHQTQVEDALEQIRLQLDLLRAESELLSLLVGITLLALLLAPFSRSLDPALPLTVLLILALALLYLGLATPMIDIDARIGRLAFQLVGEQVSFTDQVLFFQSKSILEVVQILVAGGDPKLTTVGLLILLFSILFPLGKILLTASWLCHAPMRRRDHPLVHFLVFRSAKWSMADVMVISIFMAYLGFDGVLDNQLNQLARQQGNLQVITTSSSELQLGFYYFTAFCVLGLIISQLVQYRIRDDQEPQPAPLPAR